MEPSSGSHLRPSNSNPSLRPISNRPSSVRSTGSGSGAYRHGLLRTNLSREHSVEKEAPIPPVLTREALRSTGRDITQRPKHRRVSIPTRQSSKTDLMLQYEQAIHISESPRPTRVCIDPTMHPPGTHAKIHHPGLVADADFCDAGLPVERESPIRSPPSSSSLTGLTNNVSIGQVHYLLTGDNPCAGQVDVSDHIHGGHTSAVKVRPAMQPYYGDESNQEHHGVSKVQPAPDEVAEEEIIYEYDAPITAPDITLEHLHHSRTHTPEARPILDRVSSQSSGHDSLPNDAHQGHAWTEKVQPHNESSALLSETEQNPIPGAAVQPSQNSESSKATLYWGFLPKLGGNRNEILDFVENAENHSPSRPEHRESIGTQARSKDQSVSIPPVEIESSRSTSRYSTSQESSNIVSKAASKLIGIGINQENVRHNNESAEEVGKPPIDSAHQLLQNDESDHLKNNSIAERIDPRRTATWLRGLLGYPESDGSKFTKLPEKLHPRHQDHEDYPKNERGSVLSRVTTYSGENAADAGVMDAAMHDLEELLSEALNIANEVSEKDYCRHVDDGSLRPHFQNTSEEVYRSSEPPSVRESFRSDSNDAVHELILAGTPPNIHVGAVEDLAHGCEALPLRSLKRLGLYKPGMRSGNIRGPTLPDRISSVRARKTSGRSLRKLVRKSKGSHGVNNPKDAPNRREVRDYIRVFHEPPIGPRNSSRNLQGDAATQSNHGRLQQSSTSSEIRSRDLDVCSLDGSTSNDVIDFSTQYNADDGQGTGASGVGAPSRSHNHNFSAGNTGSSRRKAAPMRPHEVRNISLRNKSHVSIRDGQRFSLVKSVKRQPPIARDWSSARKRFVASVACLSTALIGVLVGIYAGLVPSIQYYITDLHHYAIIGNVALYFGMALSTFFCWPLSLLHGRKTYIVCSLCLAMPLLFPQAIAVSTLRSPYTSVWRWALLFPRGLMGCALGFANVNFHSILTDLFGASLMSRNPHQEVVDRADVRRHGGGLGVWLGVWTWCFIGSLGVGFLPSWGLYISIICIAVVLVLNVLCPEVRRSAWRRSVAEVRVGSAGQEVYHGAALSLEMLRQPGFAIMAVYSAWIYAQVVLIIVVREPVCSCVSSIALGALAAVPFQMANVFSRARSTGPLSNSMTFDRKVTWTSHLVRRAIFVLVLPIAGALYTVVSSGPPMHIATWDCSDLQPGMTGQQKSSKDGQKRTNYSSFPRVTAGWNIIHSIGFVFAAGATGIGGMATRNLGQRAATGVVASILLVLTLLLLGVFARFQRVLIIPHSKTMEMDRWTEERRDSIRRRASVIAAAKSTGKDRPIILGNPSEKLRRMNIIEMGSLTRWSEIRKRNRLIDEGVHLNRQAVNLARDEIGRRADEFMGDFNHSVERFSDLVRKVSKRSLRSKRSRDSDKDDHPQVELHGVNPPGPPGAGLEHQHAALPRNAYFERECVMGQAVPEEAEEVSSVDGGSDDDYARNRSQDHASHMTPKVQPYPGFEKQETRGGRPHTGDYAVDVEASRREHAFHMQPKVRPADPDGAEHREQHGAHMASKVEPADMEIRMDMIYAQFVF
ncbi:hypothetical protein F4779DRAFT_628702 [Xylariaceae sp. FL0662B]|nr:hypothetical protein F4779DRAFT_628702 [Xylariaceae sp. FL0662B]